MLVELGIKNMRSIKDATLSFEKSGIAYRNRYVFREKYLNPITLYGDNGSGKSIVLYAVKQLVLLMNYDEVQIGKESRAFPDLIKVFPMLSSVKSGDVIDATISFPSLSFHFLSAKGLDFEYRVVCSGATILAESLVVKAYNDGKPILVRNGNSFRIASSEKNIAVKETYSAVRLIGIEEYTDSSSVNAIVKECFECMRKVIYIDSNESAFGYKFNSSISFYDTLLSSPEVALRVSRFSALPSFQYITKEDEKGNKVLYFDFGEGKELPFVAASDGVLRQNHLLTALEVACADEDSVVVIDEISRSIHPLNLKSIVDEFVSKDIQLIFSCHDTNLMKYLRPDQIYFAYYDNLESVYHRLSALHPNIREINNIETMYLKGLFDEDFAEANR